MKKVDVYLNLHTGWWSLRNTTTRLVERTMNNVTLRKAIFVVSEKGRQRVLKEKRKNVHAFVRGQIAQTNVRHTDKYLKDRGYRQAYYNPYKTDFFIDLQTGEPLLGEYDIHMRANDRSVWYKESKHV